MFFKDGVFVKNDTKLQRTFYKIDYLRKIEHQKQPETNQFYNWNYWGIYKVNGDTIKLQYVNHQEWTNPYWLLLEVWYKVIDENTLKVIYSKDYSHDRGSISKNENNVTIDFFKTNITLQSDTWLKKEEWFWCNEADWNNYMETERKKQKSK